MRNNLMFEDLVQSTFEKFSSHVGSEQIATKEALRVIGRYLHHQKPKTILEIGAGIGTITSFCQSVTENTIEYYAFEKNSWCQTQLKALCLSQKVRIIVDLADLHGVQNLDFLIVDDMISELEMYNIIGKLSSVFTIIVEGHRYRQRRIIMRILKKQAIPFKYVNVGKSSDSYKGAGVFFNDSKPLTSRLKVRTLFYLLRVRLNIWFMKYRQFRARLHLRKMLGLS